MAGRLKVGKKADAPAGPAPAGGFSIDLGGLGAPPAGAPIAGDPNAGMPQLNLGPSLSLDGLDKKLNLGVDDVLKQAAQASQEPTSADTTQVFEAIAEVSSQLEGVKAETLAALTSVQANIAAIIDSQKLVATMMGEFEKKLNGASAPQPAPQAAPQQAPPPQHDPNVIRALQDVARQLAGRPYPAQNVVQAVVASVPGATAESVASAMQAMGFPIDQAGNINIPAA